MKQLVFCKIFVLLLYSCLCICDDYNTVYLNQGAVQGTYNTLGDYWTYFGIPYADFKGRFQEPGNPPTWSGVFKANRSPLSCTQYSYKHNAVIGVEDCLNLNVYTPNAPYCDNEEPRPVIFFIHGGAFNIGSDSNDVYNPRYLVQKDVVFVTFNYRVGAFGFLCLRKYEAAGNMGMKDILAALKWVKDNIANFGGDPGRVTLFGQSTGASCVDYLILTQSSTGLFHRAILHSGTSLTMQSFDRDPILTASQAVSRLGYTTTDTDELLNIFLNATADEIASMSNRDQKHDALATYIFKPCVEDPNVSNMAVITSSPQMLLKSVGDISNISIILGYNNLEGIFWTTHYDDADLKMLGKNFSSAVPNTYVYKKPEYREKFIEDIQKFYFNNTLITYDELIDYLSDVMVIAPSIATIEAYMMNPKISMYNYYFSYESKRNMNLINSLSHFKHRHHGATHKDELFYLLDPKEFRNKSQMPNDEVMIEIMSTLWTNFVKTGVPSTYTDFEWPTSENRMKFLNLDKEIKIIDAPNEARINFWKRASEKYLDKN